MKLLALRQQGVTLDSARDAVKRFVTAVDRNDHNALSALTTRDFTIGGEPAREDWADWLAHGEAALAVRTCELLDIQRLPPSERDGFSGHAWQSGEHCVVATLQIGKASIAWGLVLVQQHREVLVRAVFNPLPLLDWTEQRQALAS